MRLGIDCYAMQDPASAERGIGRYARDLVRAIVDAADPGDEFDFYLVDGMDDGNVAITRERGGIVHYIPDVPRTNPYTCGALDAYLAGGNHDQVDAVLLLSPIQSNLAAGRPVPRVASVFYDLIPFVFADIYLKDPRYAEACYNYLSRLWWYDAILTMSESARRDLIDLPHVLAPIHIRRGFPPARVHAIGADANPYFCPAADDDERTADRKLLYSIGIYGRFVLNVGHEDPRKGTDRLARAFALLPAEMKPGLQLVFAYAAGPRHQGEILELSGSLGMRNALGDPELLAELGMSPPVVFTGWVGDDVLRALYREAAVMVFPSLYEGFGLPILEAMRCGCPVIAGDNSSQAEVLGPAGILVDAAKPGEIMGAMCAVLEAHDLAAGMSRAGLERAARCSWPVTARKALAAIRGE